VGRYAAERALSRLKSRKIATTQCPVLFESPLAAGLLGGFVQAVSGGALYRKSSFLLDSLGKPVFPEAHRHQKTRTCCAARAARRLTKRACAAKPRKVVEAGGWRATS
jgi:PmbA protein